MAVTELRIAPAGDPMGTPIETWTDADILELKLEISLNDLGKNSVKIPRGTWEGSSLVAGQSYYCRVHVPYIEADNPFWGFWLIGGEFVLVDDDERGGEDVTIGGPGPAWILTRAILPHEERTALIGAYVQDGTWYWDGKNYGQILNDLVGEDNASPFPALDQMETPGWSATLDVDGTPWEDFPGIFSQPVGTDYLSVIRELQRADNLDVWITPSLNMRAFVAYGRDLSGTSYGAGVVRFVGSEVTPDENRNIIGNLTRTKDGGKAYTHVLILGNDRRVDGHVIEGQPIHELAIDPDFVAGDPVYQGFIDYPTNSHIVMEQAGQRLIKRSKDRSGRMLSCEVMPGQDEANGLYLPGAPGTDKGNYWIGDTVTFKTGGGDDFDLLNRDLVIAKIRLELDKAADDSTNQAKARSWRTWIETGDDIKPSSSASSSASPGGTGGGGGGGGGKGCSCRVLCTPNLPESAALGTVLFDSEMAGENDIIPDWTEPDADDVGEGFNRLNLGDAGSTNPGPENHDEDPIVSVINSVGTTDPNWTGDACLFGFSVGTSNSRRACWGLLEGWTLSPHLMDAADGSIGESGWQIHVQGTVKHVRSASAPGAWPNVTMELEAFSDTNAGTKSQTDTVLVTELVKGETESFDEIIDLDPDTQSITIETHATSGSTGQFMLIEHLRVVLLRPEDPPVDEAWEGDGHVDLVGTSNRAARCDHAHTVFRDTAPTVDDDTDAGYHVGTAWVQVDDLEAPTSIVGSWLLLDNSAGAAVWESTLGAGGGAPDDATYLVTAAHAGLSAEVVVGATPGGELGGTWAAPTVDATHSGSAHHAQAHAIGGADHTGTLAHTALSSVTADQHHAEAHNAAHENGGADEIEIEDLGTAETDTALVLHPTGSGGVVWGTDATGGGGGLSHSYLGYNTIGGTAEQTTANRWLMKKVTVATAGIITSIGAYLQGRTNGVTPNVMAQVLEDNAGAPRYLLAFGASATINPDNANDASAGAARWVHVPIGLYVPAADYWICFQVSGTTFNVFKDGSGADRYMSIGFTGAADAGFVAVTTTTDRYSIRASLIT